MGHHMMHGSGGRMDDDWPRLFMIPIPMAIFGMVTSCMFGVLMGVMMGKKAGMHGGKWGRWKKGMHHHHHGMGPACCCSDWNREQTEGVEKEPEQVE